MGRPQPGTSGSNGQLLVKDLATNNGGSYSLDQVLAHHGVKGMKWGVRRDSSSSGSSSSSTSKPASSDSKAASAANSKAHNGGGLHVLSNHELQQAITRMNLESQYRNLTTTAHKSELDKGLHTTQKILKIGKTAEDVRKFLDTPTGKAVKAGLKGAFVVGKVAAAGHTGGASAAAGVGAGLAVRRMSNHFTNGPQ